MNSWILFLFQAFLLWKLTSISRCSGYSLCPFVGQVWTWSLQWIFSLHFVLPTFIWCSDRPRVTRWEGRTTNSNIFLGDWGEFQLQWSWMSADWSSLSALKPSTKRKRKKRMSHFVHFTVNVPCQWIFLFTHTFDLPFWWGGCCSAFCNHGWFSTVVGSSRSNIGVLLISILLSCCFDLNEKDWNVKYWKKQPLFRIAAYINGEKRRGYWNYLCQINASLLAVVGTGRGRCPIVHWTRMVLGFVRGGTGNGVGGSHGVKWNCTATNMDNWASV